jgi:hypothetical protein
LDDDYDEEDEDDANAAQTRNEKNNMAEVHGDSLINKDEFYREQLKKHSL